MEKNKGLPSAKIIIPIVLAIVVIIVGIGLFMFRDTFLSKETSANEVVLTEAITTTQTTAEIIYKTSTKWDSISQCYIFAIEDDEFYGDILREGTYSFNVTNNKQGEAPMYHVYIRKESNLTLDHLGDSDFLAGGRAYTPMSYELGKGEYIYIIPCELSYIPKGYLTIDLEE